jgi:hypothetical protein
MCCAFFKNNEWGIEYHLLAVATFLKSEIYVYTYFDKQLDQNLTPQALSEVFKNKQSTGMHFTYEPLDSEFESSVVNKKVIYGHFDLKRSQYTALIPKEHERFEFKPRYIIFLFIINKSSLFLFFIINVSVSENN